MKPRTPIEKRDARPAPSAIDSVNGSGDQRRRRIAATRERPTQEAGSEWILEIISDKEVWA